MPGAKTIRRTEQKKMNNLRLAEAEIAEMEHMSNMRAIRIGHTVPYHLQYARTFRENETVNPHMPGKRRPAAGQKGEQRK